MAEQVANRPVPRADDPDHSLRRNSVRLLGAIGNAVGIQAPSAGVTFLPALMAGIVGLAGPLSFGLAVIAMLFVAYAFVIFTREFASTGSVYAFNGTAMGPSYGFVSAFLLLFVYLAYASSVYASGAAIFERLLPTGAVWWFWIAVVLWVLTLLLTYRSIGLSSGVTLALEAVALVLVVVVAVAVLIHGGYHGHGLSATPFTPHGLGFSTITLGVVFAFTGFSGFEVAATLGEESGAPTRVIPFAMVLALLVSGLIYTFFAWIETVSFPDATALSNSGLPLVTIANQNVTSGFGTVINVAAFLSGLGAQFACVNGATRLLFALSRDGFGPRVLSRTHPRHKSPVGALAVVGVLSLVGLLPLLGAPPLDAFFDLSTYGADLIILAYFMTLVAAVIWTLRTRRWHPLRVLLLVVGAVIMGYIIKDTVYPIPVHPFNLDMYAAGATLLAGILLVAGVPRLRRRLAGSPLFTVFHEPALTAGNPAPNEG